MSGKSVSSPQLSICIPVSLPLLNLSGIAVRSVVLILQMPFVTVQQPPKGQALR